MVRLEDQDEATRAEAGISLSSAIKSHCHGGEGGMSVTSKRPAKAVPAVDPFRPSRRGHEDEAERPSQGEIAVFTGYRDECRDEAKDGRGATKPAEMMHLTMLYFWNTGSSLL